MRAANEAVKGAARRPAAWLKERKSLVKNYKQLFSLVGVFMNKKIRTDAVSHLFEAILTLENEEECFEFFEDLCTVNELLSLSQRFAQKERYISQDCREDRCVHGDNQPCEPVSQLWK